MRSQTEFGREGAHVNPGIVKLAQLTGGKIFPMHIEYSRCWRLKSWDGFMIPKPFATVEITFDALHHVAPTADEAEFEAERLRLERMLQPRDGGVRRYFQGWRYSVLISASESARL